MKIRITLEVDDKTRRAIRRNKDKRGLATRAEVLKEHAAVWDAHLDDVLSDADSTEAGASQ
jgi:hypothetical protein